MTLLGQPITNPRCTVVDDAKQLQYSSRLQKPTMNSILVSQCATLKNFFVPFLDSMHVVVAA
jgi:hypothetical protein